MINKLSVLLVSYILFAANCSLDEKITTLEQRALLRQCPIISKNYAKSSTLEDGFFLAVVCVDSTTDQYGKRMKPKCPPPAKITWEMLEPVMSTTSDSLKAHFKQDALACIKDSCDGERTNLIPCNYLISPLKEKNLKTIISEYNAQEVLGELFTLSCNADTDALRLLFISAHSGEAHSGKELINDNAYNPNNPFYKRNTKQYPCVYKVIRVQGNCQCKGLFLL